MSSHNHLLFLELLRHVLGRRPRHVDPRFREEGTGAEHEDYVEQSVDWILCNVTQCLRWTQVVTQPTYWIRASRASSTNVSPHTEQVNEKVSLKLRIKLNE